MTIKIERDAILCVMNNHDNGASSPADYDDFCLKKKTTLRDLVPKVELHSSIHSRTPDLDDTDDESTVSTFSSTSTSTAGAKYVSFAEPLVTEVRIRPPTLRKHVRDLFYSVEETQRFRQEYRTERRLKAQDEADSASQSTSTSPGSNKSSGGIEIDTPRPHRISRVVIFHENAREMYTDGENSCYSSLYPMKEDQCKAANGNFFDNDSFWSGQITWY